MIYKIIEVRLNNLIKNSQVSNLIVQIVFKLCILRI